MTIIGVAHVQLAMPAGTEDEATAFYEGVLGIPSPGRSRVCASSK